MQMARLLTGLSRTRAPLSLFAAAAVIGTALAQSGGEVLPPGLLARGTGTGDWTDTVAVASPDLRTHTLYYPLALGDPATAGDVPLPLVIWGNGGCRDNGLAYGVFLGEIASHGYFVVALGYPRAPLPPGAADAADGDTPPTRGADPTQAEQMQEAMDWAMRHNASPNSPFYGRIDIAKVGVFGHSCGGLQAIKTAADPRVTTALFMNSGIINTGPTDGPMGIRVSKDELMNFHTPVAYVTGGPNDIAHANSIDDVARIQHVPVFFAHDRSGHGGTYFTGRDGGDYAEIAVDWFDWQLKGDAQAAMSFLGEECGICERRRWTVERQPSN